MQRILSILVLLWFTVITVCICYGCVKLNKYKHNIEAFLKVKPLEEIKSNIVEGYLKKHKK